MLNISLCMIIKNEIEVLERCINSAKNFVTEIIVIDTGSSDGSFELAEKLGCKVYFFEWMDDFSLARNFGIEKATNDWVLILDADEYITKIDEKKVTEFLCKKNEFTLFHINVKNLYDSLGQNFSISPICRVFNKNNFKYKRSIHEFIECKSNWSEKYEYLPIDVDHTGYIKEVYADKNKYDRNIKLIEKELAKEKDYYLVMHLAKSYMTNSYFQKAIPLLEEILDNKENNKYTYYKECIVEYIKCLLNTNQFEKALTCEKYWDRCKSYDEYIYFMGHAFMKNGQFEKAMDCFLYITNLENPSLNKNNAYFSLASMFEVLGFIEESISYYKMCGTFGNADKKVLELKEL